MTTTNPASTTPQNLLAPNKVLADTASNPQHPEGATLHLGGNAWAHPALTPLLTPIDTIHPHPDNPRRGDQDAITASIRDHGLHAPIRFHAETGNVLMGNHTLRGLLQLGATHAPTIPLHVSDQRGREMALRDNRTAELGTNDTRALYDWLTALPDVSMAGYRDDDLTLIHRLLEAEDVFTGVGTEHMLDEFRDITGDNPSEYTPGYLAKITVYFAHEEAVTEFKTRLGIQNAISARTESPEGWTLDLWRRYRGHETQ